MQALASSVLLYDGLARALVQECREPVARLQHNGPPPFSLISPIPPQCAPFFFPVLPQKEKEKTEPGGFSVREAACVPPPLMLGRPRI